jgi:hypothetical protein
MNLEQKIYGLPLWQWLLIAAGAYGVWKFVIEPKLTPAVPAPAAQPPALLPAPAQTTGPNMIAAPPGAPFSNYVADAGPQAGVSGVEAAPQPAKKEPPRRKAGKLDLEALLEARGMGGNWGGQIQ